MRMNKIISILSVITLITACGSEKAKTIFDNNCKLYKDYEPEIKKALTYAKSLNYPGLDAINIKYLRVKQPQIGTFDNIFGTNMPKDGEFQIETSKDGITYNKIDSIVFNYCSSPESLTMYIAPYGKVYFDSRNQLSATYIFNMYPNQKSIEFVNYREYKDSYGTDKYKEDLHTKIIK